MNLKKIIASGAIVLGIGAVASPIIYDKQINNLIEKETNILKKEGVILSLKSNKDTSVKIDREYILKINDISYLIKTFYKDVPSNELYNLQQVLNGTTFLITLNLTKYPIYHKNAVRISLLSLNPSINKELETSKIGKKILEFIKNKGIQAILDINNLDVAKIKLKDINLKLNENNENLNIKLTNMYTLFEKNTISHIDKIQIKFDSKNGYFNAELNNLDDVIRKNNEFNYDDKTSIQKISLKLNNNGDKAGVELNNISSLFSLSSFLNKLNISNNFNIKETKIESGINYINVRNFTFNNALNGLDLNSIKQIVNMMKNNTAPVNPDALVAKLQTIINKGFDLKINLLSFDNIDININQQPFNISKFSLYFNTTLFANNLDLQKDSDISKLANSVEGNLNIVTTKTNANLLSVMAPQMAVYLPIISKQKVNSVIIDLSYKNGKLLSNGRPLF